MESVDNNKKSDKTSLQISFACAGWLKMYMFGVAQAFKECGLHQNAIFAGSSAGALCGLALAIDADIYAIREFIIHSVQDCHKNPLQNAFSLRKYVINCFEENCPSNGAQLANNRVETAVTLLPFFQKKRYTYYYDREHLKQTVIASCCFTPIAGFPFFLDGKLIFDGGATDFQPLCLGFEEQTITVNPFYLSRADIKPSQYVPPYWAIYPPSEEKIKWLFDLGRSDGLSWIGGNEIIHKSFDKAAEARAEHLHSKKELIKQKMLTAGLSLSRCYRYINMMMVLRIISSSNACITTPTSTRTSSGGGGGSTASASIGKTTLLRSARYFRSAISPTVLLTLCIPQIGRALEHLEIGDPTKNRLMKLWQQSLMFRLVVFWI